MILKLFSTFSIQSIVIIEYKTRKSLISTSLTLIQLLADYFVNIQFKFMILKLFSTISIESIVIIEYKTRKSLISRPRKFMFLH